MNELDQFMKHVLKVKHYARYTDDFIILADDREYLKTLVSQVSAFLRDTLSLSLHPQKVTITSLHQGIDFLGYVVRPHHILLRKTTRKRMVRKLKKKAFLHSVGALEDEHMEQSLNSYLGVLSHADEYCFSEWLKNEVWIAYQGIKKHKTPAC